MVTLVNIMVMNGWLTSSTLSIGRPIPEIRLFQTLTLKFQGQGHGCGQRARSYSRPSILLTLFLFISYQLDQQSLRYSYLEIWPWNIQGQGHEWGQRSRSHIIPCIQPMHFLFVSHQSDQPFLRYDQNNVWPWKKQTPIKSFIKKFLSKFAKITVSNKTSPKSNQVITMTRAIKLHFEVISWVVFSLYCADKQICANGCHSHDLGSRPPQGHPVRFPRLIYSLSQISKI